jgi:hypothetical protein
MSEGGSRILRHAEKDRPYGVAEGDGEALEAIDKHLRAYIGEPANVFHELLSDIVHIDVHMIAPSAQRDFYTLVTTGMSDLPMTGPEGAEDMRYAELMLALPRDWTPGLLWEADLEDEVLYWPIRLLKMLARLPHSYGTWLGVGHTIPNGDPAEPYAKNTELCCAMILPPVTLPKEAGDESEMKLTLKKGADWLTDQLSEAGVTELIDPKRRVAGPKKKKFIFF